MQLKYLLVTAIVYIVFSISLLSQIDPNSALSSDCCWIEIINTGPDEIDLANFPVISEGPNSTFKVYKGGVLWPAPTSIFNILEQPINGTTEKKICLDGSFKINTTIKLSYGQVIYINDFGEVTFTNPNLPGFDLSANGGVLGSGSENKGTIFGGNYGGVVHINNLSKTHSNFNTVSGLNISNKSSKAPTGIAILIENLADLTCGNSGAGVCKALSGDDNGSSYFNEISELDINNYGTGIRLVGHANSTFASNINISNVFYGIWSAGGLDNMFRDITCKTYLENGTVIRLNAFENPDEIEDCSALSLDDDICNLVSPYNNGFWNIAVLDCSRILEVQEGDNGLICPLYNNNPCKPYAVPKTNSIYYSVKTTNCSRPANTFTLSNGVDYFDTNFKNILTLLPDDNNISCN